MPNKSIDNSNRSTSKKSFKYICCDMDGHTIDHVYLFMDFLLEIDIMRRMSNQRARSR